MKAIVTGGAGLVGSVLCRKLLDQGASVLCVDNLTLGTPRHIEEFFSHPNFVFKKWDVSVPDWYVDIRHQQYDSLFHLAANSDISLGFKQPEMDYRRTLLTTFETLRCAHDLKIPNFIFSSTSAVYGENPVFPTPELSKGMHPVSIYGAGKLAAEVYISAFVNNYGLNAWVYRFGNVVGKKLTHGVIFDFVQKLKKNPKSLNVLGNGKQNKTYIDVEDCVNGILFGLEKSPAGKSHHERFQIFNLSSEGQTSVKEIAEYVVEVATNGKASIGYGSESIGWVGDVAQTKLDVQKMKSLGFETQLDSTTAVQQSIQRYYEWSK